MGSLDIHRKRAQALDRVHQINHSMAAANFADPSEIGTKTAQELDETDGQQARATSRLVDAIESRGGRQPFDLNAFGFKAPPGVLVGRELALEGHDFVAGAPVETHGHGGDALGGVLDDGNFLRRAVHQTRRAPAKSFITFEPTVVVERSPVERVLRDALHRLGRRAAERSHRGVVEINQIAGDGEEFAMHEYRVIFWPLSASNERILGSKRKTMHRLVTLTAASLLAFSLLAADKKKDPDEIGNRDVGKGVNFYSIEKEIALGKGLAMDVERQAKIIDDPVIAEYVNRLGQNLVRNSDAKVPFTIKVIDTEEVNAFALPGGFFFVNSGLILKADTEAELAGVMSHEIAHVAARHGTRQATRGEIAQLATIPLIFMGGWTGYGIQQAASVAIPVGFLSFSRGFESEADLLGLEYLYKSGYDPEAFVDFFEKIQSMEKKKPGTMSKVFSTHPMTEDRIQTAQKNIQELLKERPEYVVTTSEFNDVKGRLMAMHNKRKVDTQDLNRPTLRKAPGASTGNDKDDKSGSDDDRPTLKRRPDQF